MRAGSRVVPAVVGTVAGLVALIAVKAGPSPVVGATGTGSTGGSGRSGTGSSAASSGTGSSGTGTSGTSGTSTSSGSSTLTSGTFTGDSADTRYGPVQVKVTVSGGTISAVDVVDVPMSNPRDAEINQQAVPLLVQETVGRADAQIDFISGATFTSDGYQRSLQSAIDKAKG